MSKPLQAKLLRFLEDGTFTRVGGTQELRVNVRLIAATNRDIAQAIAGGQFREDLFHRLNVVQFQLPPLRDRGDDVLLLAEHFLKMFRATMNKNVDGLAPAARQKMLLHRWPGNVRELRNAIERALILETAREIQPSSLPDFQIEARLARERDGPAGAGRIARRCADADRTGIDCRRAGAERFQPDTRRRTAQAHPPFAPLPDAAAGHASPATAR